MRRLVLPFAAYLISTSFYTVVSIDWFRSPRVIGWTVYFLVFTICFAAISLILREDDEDSLGWEVLAQIVVTFFASATTLFLCGLAVGRLSDILGPIVISLVLPIIKLKFLMLAVLQAGMLFAIGLLWRRFFPIDRESPDRRCSGRW